MFFNIFFWYILFFRVLIKIDISYEKNFRYYFLLLATNFKMLLFLAIDKRVMKGPPQYSLLVKNILDLCFLLKKKKTKTNIL